MTDDRLAGELAGIRERAAQITGDGHELAECIGDLGGSCTAHDAERLAAAVEAVLDLHRPFGIYDECEHSHTEDELAGGTVIDTGMYYACRDSLMYEVCTECCTEGMEQTEGCAAGHKHGPSAPRCRTYAAIAAALLGEGA